MKVKTRKRRVTAFVAIGAGLAMISIVLLVALLPPKGFIPVLMYHFVVPSHQVGPTSLDVSTERFESHMRFLRAFGFRPISMDQYYRIRSGEVEPSGKEVAVTFDDGNQSYADYALPIMSRYLIPSTNFFIWENVVQKLHGSMDTETARRVVMNRLVTAGSHTLTHPVLPDSIEADAREEIHASKTRLEELLNARVNYFSYPTGAYDEQSVQLAKQVYALGFTTSWKRVPKGQGETLHTVVRIKVNPEDNLLVFWLKLSGIYSGVQWLRYQS